VIKAVLSGAVAAALLVPTAGATAAPRAEALAWIIAPGTQNCRIELELAGASGATVQAALVSDGDDVHLVFAKADAPERAFLPIRIDHKPFANLVLRQAGGKTTVMQFSAETLAALRKGGALQIGWLADEPVQIGLAGSDQALTDLRTCGLQVSERFRADQAIKREARERTEAQARAQAIADEQLAAAKAQKAAAEAETERNAAEAESLRAAANAERQRAQAEARERAQQQARADRYPYARADDYVEYPRDSYYPPDPYNRYAPPAPYRRW